MSCKYIGFLLCYPRDCSGDVSFSCYLVNLPLKKYSGYVSASGIITVFSVQYCIYVKVSSIYLVTYIATYKKCILLSTTCPCVDTCEIKWDGVYLSLNRPRLYYYYQCEGRVIFPHLPTLPDLQQVDHKMR